MNSSGKDVGTRVYLKRSSNEPQQTRAGVDDAVRDIIKNVRENGEPGAISYARKFDNWDGPILMSREAIKQAISRVSKEVQQDIRFAHSQILNFAKIQRKSCADSHTVTASGVICGSRVLPLSCAGCYVPGGRYAHIASALMTVTSAKAAGVPVVVASSPPKDAEGIHPAVVFAMVVAGVDHILCIGGAQALASMAFGLFTGNRADILVGPGNRFVVAAKRQLFGEVGIDMIAGPTEACVLADDSADPLVVSTDLVSQCEHGLDSPCVLVTTSARVGRRVVSLVPELIDALPKRARDAASVSWRDYGEIIHVSSREEMCECSDEIASEHLEVHCTDLEFYHDRLRNYGSLFLGEETCITFGDKTSGPNHVLPTRKASRYSGGLNVMM
eukprot:g3989.t1